jgi:Flp pilus assembly protein TadD
MDPGFHRYSLFPSTGIACQTILITHQMENGMPDHDTLSAEFYVGAGIAKYNCGDFQGAIIEFTRAIALNPDGWSYFSRGETYMVLGNMNEAQADFEKAMALGHSVSKTMLDRCK